MRVSFVLLAVCLFGFSAALPKSVNLQRQPTANPKECPTCVNLMIQGLDILVNALANGGVIGGCEGLCSYLPTRVEAGLCDAICIYAGVEEFVKLLNSTDPDPIFMCESIGICPVSDTAAASIISVVVGPASAPLGSTFYINMTFAILNETGTGTLEMWAVPPNTPYDDGFGEEGLMIQTPPGTYQVSFQIDTKGGDFVYGTYNCSVWLCEGYCDSIHKHQYPLAHQTNLEFTIVKK